MLALTLAVLNNCLEFISRVSVKESLSLSPPALVPVLHHTNALECLRVVSNSTTLAFALWNSSEVRVWYSRLLGH